MNQANGINAKEVNVDIERHHCVAYVSNVRDVAVATAKERISSQKQCMNGKMVAVWIPDGKGPN